MISRTIVVSACAAAFAVLLSSSAQANSRCATASACIEEGMRYETGFGVKPDRKRARKAYERACRKGAGIGCLMKGDMETGDVAERFYRKAATAFRKGCDANKPGDCYQLGFLLNKGKGVASDPAAAVKAHRRAYDGYLKKCKRRLDACDTAGKVANGSGSLLRDKALATRAFRQSLTVRERRCNSGKLKACLKLGILFRDGKGVPRDSKRALALLLKACEGGLKSDCNLAASLYAMGSGTEMDMERAVELYTRACKAGNPFSCRFQNMYCRGDDKPSTCPAPTE